MTMTRIAPWLGMAFAAAVILFAAAGSAGAGESYVMHNGVLYRVDSSPTVVYPQTTTTYVYPQTTSTYVYPQTVYPKTVVRPRTVVRPEKGMGHGPTGRYERNPYHPLKWWRNSPGMIDAINRDYPPVYPRGR